MSSNIRLSLPLRYCNLGKFWYIKQSQRCSILQFEHATMNDNWKTVWQAVSDFPAGKCNRRGGMETRIFFLFFPSVHLFLSAARLHFSISGFSGVFIFFFFFWLMCNLGTERRIRKSQSNQGYHSMEWTSLLVTSVNRADIQG